MKKNQKKSNKIFHILTSLILCLVSAFSFVGCIGSFGGSSGGSGSSGGGSGGSGGSSGGDSGSSKPWTPSGTPSFDDYTSGMEDLFAGAIGVYELDRSDETAFYDQYAKKTMSFNNIVDRHFSTMATYLYNSLNRVYGVSDRSATMEISGYRESSKKRSLEYNKLLSDTNQSIIAGLSDGLLEGSEQLNYSNAINGGYQISVSGTTISYTDKLIDGTNGAYGETSEPYSNYAWMGKDNWSEDFLKKALIYLYNNPQSIENAKSNIIFNKDDSVESYVTLRNYYSQTRDTIIENISKINLSNLNEEYQNITSINITNEYLWNVAYFVAYTMIGETNIGNSIDAYSSIFTNSAFQKIELIEDEPISEETTQKLKAFEKYKGYNVIVADIVGQIPKLSVDTKSDSKIIVSESVDSETTLFPSVEAIDKYVYYSDVNDICDAYSGYGTGKGDAVGEKHKIKKIIYLPKLSGDATSIPDLSCFLGFQVEEGELQLKLSYTLHLTSGNETVNIEFENFDDSGSTKDYITISSEASDDIEYFDMSLEGKQITNTTTNFEKVDIETLLKNSFSTYTKTINYSNGEKGEFELGAYNVYNQFFKGLKSNYIEINFEFLDNDGNALSSIPEVYFTSFSMEDTSGGFEL